MNGMKTIDVVVWTLLDKSYLEKMGNALRDSFTSLEI